MSARLSVSKRECYLVLREQKAKEKEIAFASE